jgi:hypothetical protein
MTIFWFILVSFWCLFFKKENKNEIENGYREQPYCNYNKVVMQKSS